MPYLHKDRYCIGIDPGRHMGFCMVGSGIWYDTIELGPHDSGQLARLAQTIRDYLEEPPEQILVCYEEPAMLRGHALIQIQRQIGVIMATLEDLRIPHYPVNQQSLKAWVATRYMENVSRPGKDDMVQAAHEHGAYVKDDNQADAYWLARYAQEVVWDIVFGGVDTV
jgi:hypothetical protein